MIENYCLNVIVMTTVAASVTLATPIPAEHPEKSPSEKTDSLFSIPFLEFKNGGVRVNFGGYHAEAGLGGLFGDSKTGGGLYAGAGTPFGAHASAGLGGDVNGENGGKTGGGLHAKAGLGNGGPEAAAGLGGKVDGANPSSSDGRIYAARSNGGRTRIVLKNIGGDQKSSIQRIARNQNDKLISDDAESSSETKAVKKENSDASMVRRAVTPADENSNAVEPAIIPVTDASINVYPTRRCRRTRRCNSIHPSKTIIHQHLPLSQIPATNYGVEQYIPAYGQSPPQLSVTGSSGKLVAENTGYENVAVAPGPAPIPPHFKPRSTTIFDDIFNIPISALTAVNQLLNNKAG